MNFFFSDRTQRIELFFVWLSELNFLSRNMTWLIELNLFFLWRSFKDDSKSWSLSFWLKESNLSCFPVWLKELNPFFLKMSQRIEPLFHMNIFLHDSKNLFFFSIWLKELNPFFEYDSKNWPFSKRIWFKELNLSEKRLKELIFFLKKKWLKELNFFLSMIQRLEPLFECDSMNRSHFLNVTQKLQFIFEKKVKNWALFFFWLNSTFCSHDSKNWTFFPLLLEELNPVLNMIQRFVFNWDSKNWTFYYLTQRTELFSYLTQCIEPFFLPQRIELCSKYGPKNWFFFVMWLKELNFFSLIWLTELTFFMTLRIELFQLWLKEMNLVFKYDSIFFKQKMTQIIECFFQYFTENWFFYDSKDWIFYDAKNWTFLVFQYVSKKWTSLSY